MSNICCLLCSPRKTATDRFLPDKAIDLVDEAAARLRTEIESVPVELDEVQRRVMQLEIEREALKKEKDRGALVDGAFAIIAGIKSHGAYKRWGLLLLQGILSVAAGVFAFMVPAMTAFILLILIASWAIVTGAFQIAAAIQLRKHIKGEWLLALGGVFSILFGAVLLFNPPAGALAVVWIIGAYAIIFGFLLIALGFKLRGLERLAHEMTPHPV